MKRINKLLYVVALIGFAVSTPGYAENTNFSHSRLFIGGKRVFLDHHSCINGGCVKNLQGPFIGAAIQFADVFILSGSALALYGLSQTWTGTLHEHTWKIAIVEPIGRRIDWQIGIASVSNPVEACINKSCGAAGVTGTEASGQIDFWMDDLKELAGKIAIMSVKYSNSYSYVTSLNLGLSVYQLKKNEVTLDFIRRLNISSALTLGYAYHF